MERNNIKKIVAGLMTGVVIMTSGGCTKKNSKENVGIEIGAHSSISTEDNFYQVVRDSKISKRFEMPETLNFNYVGSDELSYRYTYAGKNLINIPTFYTVIMSVETKNELGNSKSNTSFEGEKADKSRTMSRAYFYDAFYIEPADKNIREILHEISISNYWDKDKLHKSINRTVLCDQNGHSLIYYSYKVTCDGEISIIDDNGNLITIKSGESIISFNGLFKRNNDGSYELVAANQEGLGSTDDNVIATLSGVIYYTENLIEPINETEYDYLCGSEYKKGSDLEKEIVTGKRLTLKQ